MGINGFFGYIIHRKLFKSVDLKEVADKFRRQSDGEEPEIAVDGAACVWYIYDPIDFLRGGQYKKFREDCDAFVRQFRDSGIRLVFFFHGPPVEEGINTWSEKKNDKMMSVSYMFNNKHSVAVPSKNNITKMLPEAAIPSARVIFKDLGCDVYLSKGNCKHDIAKYMSGRKCCMAVLTSDSDFFVLKGVPSVVTFRNLERGTLKSWWFETGDIIKHLCIQQEHMPIYAAFVGNDFVRADLLSIAFSLLKKRYPLKTTYPELVAELMKDEDPHDLVNLCKIAFHGKWREGLTMVEAGIRSYIYEPTSWDKLIDIVEDRHTSGEIPGNLLSVMKHQLYRIGEVLEDLSEVREDSPPTGLALRPMRVRMYTVLLWESDSGLCHVTEYLLTETGKVTREVIEKEKRLPTNLKHPGLQQLWTGDDMQCRWRFFTWLVAPYAKPSLLEELDPQFLVVPAAALLFLKHEAGVLHHHEVTAFCATAAAVAGLSGDDRAANIIAKPDTRAIYLASLFVRCVLHVLDAAATCGLTFPREIDCLPDAYFDGNVFHDVCVTTQNGKDPKELHIWKSEHEATFSKLMHVINNSGHSSHSE